MTRPRKPPPSRAELMRWELGTPFTLLAAYWGCIFAISYVEILS